MKVEVVGKSDHEGISKKTGKSFHFAEIFYLISSRGVIGEAAKSLTVDATEFPFDKIPLGPANAEFDDTGRLIALTPIPQAPTAK